MYNTLVVAISGWGRGVRRSYWVAIVLPIISVFMLAASVGAQEVTTEQTVQGTTKQETTAPEGPTDPELHLQQASGLPGVEPSEGCADPVEVATFTGSETQRTEPFDVPTDVMRIRYYIEPTTEVGGRLDIGVLKVGEEFFFDFSTELVTEPAAGSENILLEEPGSYFLELRPFDVRYEVAVDACGVPDPDPDPDPGEEMVTICHEGTNTITVGTSAQDAHLAHGDIVGTCEESGVIGKTIPKNTPLPNTGGPAILAPTAGLLLLSTAALGLLCVRRR
jgi:hypothetical protein